MFIFMTIYIFITVSGCVGRGPSALFCPGAYDAAVIYTMLFIVFFVLLIFNQLSISEPSLS